MLNILPQVALLTEFPAVRLTASGDISQPIRVPDYRPPAPSYHVEYGRNRSTRDRRTQRPVRCKHPDTADYHFGYPAPRPRAADHQTVPSRPGLAVYAHRYSQCQWFDPAYALPKLPDSSSYAYKQLITVHFWRIGQSTPYQKQVQETRLRRIHADRRERVHIERTDLNVFDTTAHQRIRRCFT